MDDDKKTKAQLVEEIGVLRGALDGISDGFIVFNAEDEVVAFNTKHQKLFPSFAKSLRNGVPFRELPRVQALSGQIDAAVGREDAWIEARINEYQRAGGSAVFGNALR